MDSTDTNKIYQQGRAAHKAGDLETAVRLYGEVLATAPRHAEALHSLGNINARRGEFAEAEQAIRAAIAIDARGAGYYNSLGNVLVACDRDDEALAAYEQELVFRPDFAVTHNQLGSLFLKQDKIDRAIEHFQTAIRFAPQFSIASNNLGRALNNSRRYEEAAEAFRHAIRLSPGMAQAHANLGHVVHVLGDTQEAETHFERALQLDRGLSSAHRGLGLIEQSTGRTRDAIDHFRRAIDNNPQDARALHALGDIYFREGLIDQAQEQYELALIANPGDPDLLCGAAAARRGMGDNDKALEYYRRALGRRASDQTALAGLANLLAENGDTKSAVARLAPSVNSGRASPPLLATYATLLGRMGRRREGIALLENALQKTIENRTATQLHFALADLLDDDGSYDLAFYHCRRANGMSTAHFDPDGFARQIGRIVATQTASALAQLPQAQAGEEKPVFLIGLPRAGLAVLDSVLSVNPHMRALGSSRRLEIGVKAMWRRAGADFPDLPRNLSEEALNRLARQVLARRGSPGKTRAFFLDATWGNYPYLGVIERLFPGARIVECVRDARDIALSCFFRHFTTNRRLHFAYELANIAAVVNGYRRLMSHWRDALKSAIHTIEYESLIREPAQTCERLAKFLGVPWDPAHFAIAGAGDAGVTEPSTWRLRAKSLRRYRHYRENLESFVEALDAAPGEHR